MSNLPQPEAGPLSSSLISPAMVVPAFSATLPDDDVVSHKAIAASKAFMDTPIRSIHLSINHPHSTRAGSCFSNPHRSSTSSGYFSNYSSHCGRVRDCCSNHRRTPPTVTASARLAAVIPLVHPVLWPTLWCLLCNKTPNWDMIPLSFPFTRHRPCVTAVTGH